MMYKNLKQKKRVPTADKTPVEKPCLISVADLNSLANPAIIKLDNSAEVHDL